VKLSDANRKIRECVMGCAGMRRGLWGVWLGCGLKRLKLSMSRGCGVQNVEFFFWGSWLLGKFGGARKKGEIVIRYGIALM